MTNGIVIADKPAVMIPAAPTPAVTARPVITMRQNTAAATVPIKHAVSAQPAAERVVAQQASFAAIQFLV